MGSKKNERTNERTSERKKLQPRKMTFTAYEEQGVKLYAPTNKRAKKFAGEASVTLKDIKKLVRKSKKMRTAYVYTAKGLRKIA